MINYVTTWLERKDLHTGFQAKVMSDIGPWPTRPLLSIKKIRIRLSGL
jgi:hypothetical protein